MKDSKMQLLKDLLQKAISTTVICARNGHTISVEEYKDLYRENRNFSVEDRYARKVYDPYVQNQAVRGQILEFLKVELQEYVRDDIVSFSRTAITVIGRSNEELDSLLFSLMRVALLKGAEHAVHSFYKPIKKEWIPFQQMVLINGLKVAHEMQLYDGVRLIPPHPLTANLPDYFPVSGNRARMNEYVDAFRSASIMSIDCSVRIILRKPGEDDDTSFTNPFPTNTADGKWKILSKEFGRFGICDYLSYKTHFRQFYMLLSLVCNRAVEVAFEWDYHDASEVFAEPYAGKGVGSLEDLVEKNRNLQPVTEEEIAAAKSLHTQFLHPHIDSKSKKILEMALSRWRMAKKHEKRQARKAENQVDQMIDLGIAFESIYLGGDVRGELSFTLRIRAAWFLGKNAEERESILREFKVIYDCRSRAVHSGRLDDFVKVGKKPTPLDEFLAMAQNRCADSIKKIIERGGFPDWDKLITGNE